jgi:DNA polymerase I
MNKRVYLLDAMSFIHRAYHGSIVPGRPAMKTKAGMPTGAIFFFNQQLKKLYSELNPTYFVACCDVQGPTWQDHLAQGMPNIRRWTKKHGVETIPYLGYKAGRDEHSPDFLVQVPYIYRLLAAWGIPVCKLEGYEADDLLATLARIVVEEDPNRQVTVLTHDKDMLQLVTANVYVHNPDKGVYTPHMVREHVGVTPEQIVDMMALRGDTSDNVPGAPSIGDKGSVELIQKWGTLDQLYYNLHLVDKQSYRENLSLNEVVVRLSKKLVTLNKYVPLTLKTEDLKMRPTDPDALGALMEELEFRPAVRHGLEFPHREVTEDMALMDEIDMSEAL